MLVGDWIDAGAAKATGSTQSRMCALKERGIDLLSPQSREEEALALYYKSLIEYCIDQTAIDQSVRRLPIFVVASKKMLVLLGSSYAARCWCIAQLCGERHRTKNVRANEQKTLHMHHSKALALFGQRQVGCTSKKDQRQQCAACTCPNYYKRTSCLNPGPGSGA